MDTKYLPPVFHLTLLMLLFLYIIAEFLLQMNSYKLLITAAVW